MATALPASRNVNTPRPLFQVRCNHTRDRGWELRPVRFILHDRQPGEVAGQDYLARVTDEERCVLQAHVEPDLVNDVQVRTRRGRLRAHIGQRNTAAQDHRGQEAHVRPLRGDDPGPDAGVAGPLQYLAVEAKVVVPERIAERHDHETDPGLLGQRPDRDLGDSVVPSYELAPERIIDAAGVPARFEQLPDRHAIESIAGDDLVKVLAHRRCGYVVAPLGAGEKVKRVKSKGEKVCEQSTARLQADSRPARNRCELFDELVMRSGNIDFHPQLLHDLEDSRTMARVEIGGNLEAAEAEEEPKHQPVVTIDQWLTLFLNRSSHP